MQVAKLALRFCFFCILIPKNLCCAIKRNEMKNCSVSRSQVNHYAEKKTPNEIKCTTNSNKRANDCNFAMR